MHLAFTTIILESLSLLTLAFPSNIDSSDVAAPLSKRYQPGWCGVHVVQYQKNEGPGTDTNEGPGIDTSVYRFNVTIKDASQTEIGEVDIALSPLVIDPRVFNPAITDHEFSQLPSVMNITAGNLDSDPVSYAYESQSWLSDGPTCSEGGYQDGSRQIDCGFTC